MAKSRYTRSGTRRLGDKYQDLVALEFLIEWLEHSDRYEWVSLEADDAGSLDDVVVMGRDGKLSVRQVKFSTDSEAVGDPWTWGDLLAKSQGKSGKPTDSLLEKWSKSLTRLRKVATLDRASVVSNRRPSMELASCLGADGLVDFNQVRDSATRAEILTQLGNEAAGHEFFSQFHFDLNAPGLAELEDALKRRFRRLGGTDHGWLNLCDELRIWVVNRNKPEPDGRIRLHHVRQAAGWNVLRKLAQGFEIPDDYVLPSEDFFEQLIDRLMTTQAGCIILTASPGAGKSTFASFIWHKLREKNAPVIRHHYFLSRSDRSYTWRLDHLRAAESLMHDLNRDYPEALGALSSENPHPHRLSEWIAACGQHYRERDQALVVIVDGLDHVWRDKRSVDELEKLLGFLLPTPDGVVVLLATQSVEDSKLPPMLLREAPREHWLKLPLLNQQSVTAWLRHHEQELSSTGSSPISDYWLERIAEAFYQRSGGHPLHLRYTLRALQEQNLTITSENINRLPGCQHEDITAYYSDLWRTLDEEGREVLHLMAACTFPWPQRGILKCLDPQGTRLASLKRALRQVSHLLTQNDLGWLPFHGSLLVYVAGLEDHEDYAENLKRRALTWLRDMAPDHWKWAYEWLLEAELGNNQPLRAGPNRKWAVEAIANGRPPEEISELLARSTWHSLEHGDLVRAIETGLLRVYAREASEYKGEAIEPLLLAQLELNEDPYLSARLRSQIESLSEKSLVRLAVSDYQAGKKDTAVRCFNELLERIRSDNHDRKQRRQEQIGSATILAGLVPVTDLTRIIRTAILNRENGITHEILTKLGRALRAARDTERMRQIVRLISDAAANPEEKLTPDECSIIFREAILLALEEEIDLDPEVLRPEWASEPMAAIYASVRKLDNFRPSNFEFPKQRTFYSRFHERRNYNEDFYELFYHIFFGLFANHLWDRSDSHEAWLSEIGESNWPCLFVQKLNEVAKELATLLKNGSALSIGLFYEWLKSIQRPDFREEKDVYIAGYVNAATKSCELIGWDLLAILSGTGRKSEISRPDLESVFSSEYCYLQNWITTYLASCRKWLNDQAVAWLLETQSERLASSVESFPERAEKFASLAAIAAIHGFNNEARDFILGAAENLIAHGSHKDLLYYNVFKAISVCNQASMPEAREWLLRLAAPVAYIKDYTDGDETGSLPGEMADLLAEVAPDLLPAYCQWLTEREKFYVALHAFHAFLRTADLSLAINQAIASTALDYRGLGILKERVTAGDAGAESAMARIIKLIGCLPRKKETEENHDSQPALSEQKPAPLPAAYPPDKFSEYLEALQDARRFWNREHIQKWARFWIERGRGEEVLAAVEERESRGIELRCNDEIFDLMLGLSGRNRAYPWLVRAHQDENGWSWAYASKDGSIRRWETLKKHYPEKWYDFIRDTFKSRYGSPWRELSIGHYNFERLAEYCILMSQCERAKEMVERMVESSLELVSPLRLVSPEWTDPPGVKGKGNSGEMGVLRERGIEMLFQRLVWPSLLVRERACIAIADLLLNPQESESTIEYLLSWMSACKLESFVTLGLLVLHRARMQNENFTPPAITELKKVISKPSILSWMLMKELFPDAGDELKEAMFHSGAPPSDFALDPRFEKYVGAFIPPLYDWYAQRLEENELIAFRRQWAYEWSNLLKETGAEIRTGTLDFWVGSDTKGERYGAADTLVSDVYMSSYLRALAWAVRDRGVDSKAAPYITAQACQIDLELWRLGPVSKPSWWPQVVLSDEGLDSAPAQIWEQVENLWEEQRRKTDGWIITQASGTVDAGETIYELEISGVFQKTLGVDDPSLDEISRWYREECNFKTRQKSLLRCRGTLTGDGVDNLKKNSGGWTLLSAAGRIDPLSGLRWQFWRLYRGVWMPANFLGDQLLSFRITNDGLMAFDGDDVIGKWNDWGNGLSERMHVSLPLPTGQFLEVRGDRIAEFAEVNKAVFCWVCCLTVYHRRASYEDYQQFSTHRVFGNTRLVL